MQIESQISGQFQIIEKKARATLEFMPEPTTRNVGSLLVPSSGQFGRNGRSNQIRGRFGGLTNWSINSIPECSSSFCFPNAP